MNTSALGLIEIFLYGGGALVLAMLGFLGYRFVAKKKKNGVLRERVVSKIEAFYQAEDKRK